MALTILAGGFVAGLHAGLTYNTFPLMDGSFVPAGYAQLDPFMRNWFENIAAVQFDHRLLAMTTVAGVLLLWLIAWTVGCVALLVHVLKEPSLGMFAFALPFWASWLFVAGLLVWMIFGKETLFLDRDEAIFRRTAFIRLSSRIVPRKEVQGFRECRSSHRENNEYLWGIEMVTLGKPLRFAFRLPDRERAWLIHQLNLFLGTSGPDAQPQTLQPPLTLARNASSGETSFSNSTPVATEALTFERTLAEPPTDCCWHLTEDSDAFAALAWLGGSGRLRCASPRARVGPLTM